VAIADKTIILDVERHFTILTASFEQ